jgi:pyruvate dehydrogenase E1 component alpha subunit
MDTAVKPKDYAAAPINAQLSKDDKIGLLRMMIRIRRFEQRALQEYTKQKMGGFMHLYIGQESIATGACSLMGDHDHVITAYRCHGHALAVGMTMNECMAELFGKATGCSKGKGGSMHFFAPDKNYWGGHGIVAGQTPLGLGLAFGVKYKGLKGSCMAFLGDGAVNQGVYYECLNLASLWNLPVVYVIENNRYSMGTSLERSSAFKSCLAARADGFGIVWDIANGEDLYEVRAKTKIALERAHNESRPTVLEVDTYRHYGHSVADAKHKGGYRAAEEIEKYKNQHDPVLLWRRRMIEEGVVTDEQADAIAKETLAEANASVKFAEESPNPTVDSIQEDVYFEVDRQTEAGRTGRHFFND